MILKMSCVAVITWLKLRRIIKLHPALLANHVQHNDNHRPVPSGLG